MFHPALFALLCCLSVHAADLTADLTPLVAQPRHGAPEWVEVKLDSRGTALREGALEFELRADGNTLYRYRTHELALTGTQRFRFLLPGYALPYPPLVRTWHLRFIERTRTLDLGEFSSPPRLHAGRNLVLGIVRSGVTGDTPAWQALRLEALEPPRDSATARPFATTPVFLDSDDLPLDPLGYCAFDAVLLEGDALARLREKTRTALARWVHAGGSLAVIAPTGLDTAHFTFLNDLGAPDPHWQPLAAPLTGVVTARANFGRLIVAATHPSEPHPSEPLPAEWRTAAGFLWKLRAAPLRRLAQEPRWAEADVDQRQRSWGEFSGGTAAASELVETLLPKGIRPLPPSLIWGIALGFLLVAGPLDWWLLGLARRRRLTWIVFPCTAIAFTALTIALARGHLGSSAQHGELRITDLGADGRVVRETRIALTLPVVEGELSTDIEHALSAPIVTRFERGADTAQFGGQFPARYRLVQAGRQWSPVLTRTTSLTPAEDRSGIDWSKVKVRELDASGSHKALSGFDHAFEFYRDSRHDRAGTTSMISQQWRDLLVHPPPRGPAVILAQVSPSGSPGLQDLACIDQASDDQTLAVVTTRTPGGFHIWRRLFLH